MSPAVVLETAEAAAVCSTVKVTAETKPKELKAAGAVAAWKTTVSKQQREACCYAAGVVGAWKTAETKPKRLKTAGAAAASKTAVSEA